MQLQLNGWMLCLSKFMIVVKYISSVKSSSAHPSHPMQPRAGSVFLFSFIYLPIHSVDVQFASRRAPSRFRSFPLFLSLRSLHAQNRSPFVSSYSVHKLPLIILNNKSVCRAVVRLPFIQFKIHLYVAAVASPPAGLCVSSSEARRQLSKWCRRPGIPRGRRKKRNSDVARATEWVTRKYTFFFRIAKWSKRCRNM